MKLFKLLSILSLGALTSLVTSCHNQDISFPDFDGGTSVYFAYQYPVRTLVMGEDTYDTTLDNEHRFEIYATMGGVYANKKRIAIDFVVDPSLCDNLFYDEEETMPVIPMPSEYYTLSSNQIVLDKKLQGAVGVQLSDAFFADPKALENTYVIPLSMTSVENADRIIRGTPKEEDGDTPRTYAEGWNVQPQDFVLYCVKFINKWHASYLRRGVDQITENSTTTNNVRHASSVEKDEVCKVGTASLTTAVFPVSTSIPGMGEDGEPTLQTLTCDLLLNFNDNNEFTITSGTEGLPPADRVSL